MSLGIVAALLAMSVLSQDIGPSVEEPQPVEGRRRDREKNHRHDVEPLPMPDHQPGEGESVVIPDLDFVTPEELEADRQAIEGREERERRRREREERQREQDEYDRLHPKPEKQRAGVFSWLFGGIGWLVWGAVSWFLWPFAWIFTLIKWGGIVAMLTLTVAFVLFAVLCGYLCGTAIGRVWNWLSPRRSKDIPVEPQVPKPS